MKKPFPRLCMDCKHSKPDPIGLHNNRCFHPKVVANDSWALANHRYGEPYGVSCEAERRQRALGAPCGMRGRLWEAKQ